jgi:hypothetical protein
MKIEVDPKQEKICREEQQFTNALKDTLDLPINPGSAIIYPNEIGNYLFRLPDKMEQLKGTKYFCSETKLLHFTSLKALFSIINDSSIRMYNLWNSSDKKEYSHASDIFNRIYEVTGQNAETRIKLAKTYSFISSFTSSENYLSQYHWENYGNDHKGAAIEFEINPEYQQWYKFILSRTFYNKLKDFEALFNAWHNFQNQIAIHNNSTFDIDLNWLLSLYKDKSFSNEDEIRLYLYADGYHATFPKHFAKYTYSALKTESLITEIKYFKLPLCDDSWSFMNPLYHEDEFEFWKRIPKIRISKIYIGTDLQTDNWEQLKYKIKTSIKEKTGRGLDPEDIIRVNLNLYR